MKILEITVIVALLLLCLWGGIQSGYAKALSDFNECEDYELFEVGLFTKLDELQIACYKLGSWQIIPELPIISGE